MPNNQIRVSSLLTLINGEEYRNAWTCNPRDPDSLSQVRRYFAIAQERATVLHGDVLVTLSAPSCEVITFAPSVHESTEIKMWQHVLARLSE